MGVMLALSVTSFSQQKQTNLTSAVFSLQQIHTIYLTVTAENWEKMQPPQRGGFGGGGFGPPGGMRPGDQPTGGGVVFIGFTLTFDDDGMICRLLKPQLHQIRGQPTPALSKDPISHAHTSAV